MTIHRLKHKTILYIPLKYGDGREISEDKVEIILKKSLEKLIELAGGTTVIDGVGYWKKENVINQMLTKLVITYVNDLEKAKELLSEISLWIKEETKSNAICYEIDGCLYMV